MWKRPSVAHAIFAAATTTLVACGGDQALLVTPHVDGAPPLGVVADPTGAAVHPIGRQLPFASDDRWSFDAGPSGTVVRRPSVGLTITVPAGAVSTTTHITVTALHGAALAYRFEPHGLQFAEPLQLIQSLHGLKLGPSSLGMPSLIGGYFADDSLVTDVVTGNARVIEILPIQIDVTGHSAILSIRHFSGYTVASAARDSLDVDLR